MGPKNLEETEKISINPKSIQKKYPKKWHVRVHRHMVTPHVIYNNNIITFIYSRIKGLKFIKLQNKT